MAAGIVHDLKSTSETFYIVLVFNTSMLSYVTTLSMCRVSRSWLLNLMIPTKPLSFVLVQHVSWLKSLLFSLLSLCLQCWVWMCIGGTSEGCVSLVIKRAVRDV